MVLNLRLRRTACSKPSPFTGTWCTKATSYCAKAAAPGDGPGWAGPRGAARRPGGAAASWPRKPYNITDEIWEQVSFMDHKKELAEEMRNIGDKMIIRSARHQDDEYQLTEQYGEWVAKVEEAHIINEQVEDQDAQRCRGRASGFGIRWIRAKPTPGRTHMRYGPAEEWSILTTDLVRYQSLVVNCTDVKQQSMCVKRILKQIGVLIGIPHKDAFSKHVTETSSNMYFHMAEDILDLDVGQLANLVAQTEEHLAKVQQAPRRFAAGALELRESHALFYVDKWFMHACSKRGGRCDEAAPVCCHWRTKGWCRYQDLCKFAHPENKCGAGLSPLGASALAARRHPAGRPKPRRPSKA
ncbi:unnamed protein product [Prorocentrum cordatum]|uniref:C3H1-type domain-containing protein n=1 Tax=Prorocentrum cordatum TaxID=2364126 RepID=A0ABN9RY77_9DINO|nr:unnamed protein product [Polarella glacialis]